MSDPLAPAGSPLGRYDDDSGEHLHEVRLLNLPLRLLAQGREHHDEVMRELAVLALDEQLESRHFPQRMLDLIDVLGRRYAARSAAPDAQIDAAIARGDLVADVTYHVPAHVTEAAAQLQSLMDEADEFCRGQQLLTLARPPEQVAFQRWYLAEFRRQVGGEPPQPWDGPVEV